MESKIAAVIVFLIANVFAVGLVSFQSSFIKESYAASSNTTNASNASNTNNATSKSMEAALQKEALKITPPSSSNDVQTTTTKNAIVLGNPFYIEYVKTIRQQPLVLNTGLHAIGVIFIGKGTVNGINFVQTEGKALIIPLSQGIADIVGGGLIKATAGKAGNATFNFREIAHYNPSTQPSQVTGNQVMQGTGAAIFNSNATGNLSSLSNTVMMFKDEANPNGVGTIKGWEWK
jgi:hypothetical protein